MEHAKTIEGSIQQQSLAHVQRRHIRATPDHLVQVLPNTLTVLAQAPNSAQAVCSRCKGAGFLRRNVPFGHPDFGKPVACQCKEQEIKGKRRQQLQALSNLETFAEKRFETFRSEVFGLRETFQMAVEFSVTPAGWLLLIGPSGCGKTHLAAAIANTCLEAGAVVLFATVPDLLDYLRATFAPTSEETYEQLFPLMREAEMLVLDDLGTQQSSPWANEKLFQLLNHRYNAGSPTVITANLEVLRTTDARIRSRLSDSNLVTVINLEQAHDYRPFRTVRTERRRHSSYR
jgi:DNA replication protein DnaC